MPKISGSTVAVLAWGAALGAVQGFDVGAHVASGQLEPVRVAATVVVTLWAIVAVLRREAARRSVVAAVLGAYLVLNALFLAVEGVTNPAQGGAVRWLLFVLVVATTVTVVGLARSRAAAIVRPA